METKKIDNEIDVLVQNGLCCLDEFEKLNQEQVDYIVKKATNAGLDNHLSLAKLAVLETKRGVVEDKATKNMFACEYVSHYMKHIKTVGIINEDKVSGIYEIASPVGVIAGITPVTNPTSTTIFKALIALKTRNPIIFAFHPSAQESSSKAAEIIYDAAVKAGAPKNCIQWVKNPSVDKTKELMNHDGISMILATGGNSMVKSAYSCGKPALGVGAGNVPAYMEKTCNIKRAVNDIIMSKSFDNGMVCSSEQAVIIDKEIYAESLKEFKKFNVHICTAQEKKLLEKYMFNYDGKNTNDIKLNSSVVGQSPYTICLNAGFEIDKNTVIVLVECDHVGDTDPLTGEKLSPVLAVLKAKNTKDGFKLASDMVNYYGLGHSACIHTNNENLVKEYGNLLKAIRIIWNSPTTFGAIGNVYNGFIPSLTLGCGSYGRNSISDNVSCLNLLNIKRIGRRKNNMQWFKVPKKIFFEQGSISYLQDLKDVNRVVIVTDKTMVDLGYVKTVIQELEKREDKPVYTIFSDVEPDPSIQTVIKGADFLRSFKPDTIIAIGGGSPMDAAKCMWLYYEQPNTCFDDCKQKFMDIRKRAFIFPELGKLAKLVCIPTTSGTGSEVTPFAVITDKKSNEKYPLADYALTPDVAIIDPTFITNLPKSLIADTGLDALTHATEAYVSVLANDYTDGLCIQAIKMIFKYLKKSYEGNLEAREKMHNASTIAGMAFANAFLGINHSLAHKLGGEFHIPHGRANAILLPHVIKYNGTRPTKISTWPKYESYICDEKYYELAKAIGLNPKNIEDGVIMYKDACANLAKELGIKMNLKENGIDEKEFNSNLDKLSSLAFEDQCTPANPKVALISDLKQILIDAYYSEEYM